MHQIVRIIIGSTVQRLGLAVLLLGLVACGGGADDDVSNGTPPPEQLTVSGVITAMPGHAVDGSTNNPESPLRDNNRPDQAQPLPNPVRLGGYVTATPTGWPGDRFERLADSSDFYRVALVAGQRIELNISDWTSDGRVDLELWLYEIGNPLEPVVVDAAVGTGPVETLVAPASGEYWLEVYAFRGGSNYQLSIGEVTATTTSSPQDLRLSTPLLADEVLVKTRPLTAIQRATGASEPLDTLSAAGLELLSGMPEHWTRWTVEHPQQAVHTLGATAPDRPMTLSAEQQQRLAILNLVKALRDRPEVAQAAPNQPLALQRVPNDPGFGQQWHYPLIQLPQAWDLSTGGERQVIVAVPDTGVFLAHEDLQGQLVPGYDFVERRVGGDDPGDAAVVGESSWHGTHVAGTIAARTNNNRGVAGVSWGAQIMPLRVIGRGSGSIYDLAQGMRYALGLPNDSGDVPERRADIINLSVGTNADSPLYAEVIQAARDRGVMIVAAAGNQATDRPLFPAALDGVISVTAVGPNKQAASYANFGSTIDLTAPGGEQRQGTASGVLSTWVEVVGGERRSSYGFLQGTSMATPHVAGVIALMQAIYPNLDYDTFQSLLASGQITEDLGSTGFDPRYGWGLIDALQAVFAAQSLAAAGRPSSILVAEPNTLDFGSLSSEQVLEIRRRGEQLLAVSRIDTNVNWLTIEPLAVDADRLGAYRVRVDRSGLTPATYTATITVTSSLNQVLTVPVSLRVGVSEPGDVGLIYVLLLDEDFRTVEELPVLGNAGEYRFRFSGLEPGEYFIAAGTDNDNDGFICDPGEACGAYPTLGVADPIRVEQNRADLDFVIGYSSAELRASGTASESLESRGLPRLSVDRPRMLYGTP